MSIKEMNVVVNAATKEIDRLRRVNAQLVAALEMVRANPNPSLLALMQVEAALQAAREPR